MLPVSWRIHREIVGLAGWAPAILMQFAHPLVAQGVHDHSGYRYGPWSGWRRLHGTLAAMLALTFGDDAQAARAAEGINRIHDRVAGRLSGGAGRWPAGTPYSAHDPALLTWVHATCLHAFLAAHERFVGPLTPAERDRYCEEASAIEGRLGIPPGRLPRTVAELERYLGAMLASGEIVVTDTARELARPILAPPLLALVPPVGWGLRLFAGGLLPPPLRDGYGLRWNRRRAATLAALAGVVRRLLPLVPPVLRYWPAARAAARREAGRRATAAAGRPSGPVL